MATRAIKAQRRAIAQASLNELVGKIATDYGIKRPPVALVRDPELQAVYDLEADLVVLQALYDYSTQPKKKRSKKMDEKNKYNGTPDPKDEAPPEEALTIATADGTDTVVEAGTDDIIDADADADAAPATEDDGA